jgi:hypothetical protein
MSEEAQHPIGQGHSDAQFEEVPESNSNGADKEKEMGDDGEDSVSDRLTVDYLHWEVHGVLIYLYYRTRAVLSNSFQGADALANRPLSPILPFVNGAPLLQ